MHATCQSYELLGWAPATVVVGHQYFEVVQEKEQLMVLYPDTYFWSWCEGGAILETNYHFAQDWGTGATDMADYVRCRLVKRDDVYQKRLCKFYPRSPIDPSTPNL